MSLRYVKPPYEVEKREGPGDAEKVSPNPVPTPAQ